VKQRAILPVLTPIAQQEIPEVKGDTKKLLEDLKTFLPTERLVTKPDDLFAYECDAQTFDRAVPLGVVFPESTAEVSRVVRHARTPVCRRAAGSLHTPSTRRKCWSQASSGQDQTAGRKSSHVGDSR